MQLVCQDDCKGPGRRFPEGGKVVALAVDPGPLPPLIVCLHLGTMCYKSGHDMTKPLLEIGQSRRRVLDKIVQESGNDHVLVETGSIQNPGHGDNMLHIGHTVTSAELALMSDRGEPKGLLEPGTHGHCKAAQGEEFLEGSFRLAVSCRSTDRSRKRSSPLLGRIRQRGDILRMIGDECPSPVAMSPCGSGRAKSNRGIDLMKMASDLADNLARMGQEADVPGAFNNLEPGARDQLSKQFLAGTATRSRPWKRQAPRWEH